MYPIENYKFYRHGNTIIAVTTYCGQTVRGVAKCGEGDQFDEAVGKKLAALRCDIKVNEKRVARLMKKNNMSFDKLTAALAEYQNMVTCLANAGAHLNDLKDEYEEYLSSI